MPATDYGQNLMPKSEEEHKKLLTWCSQAFMAADEARSTRADKWKRYYKLYRSYVPPRGAGDWRSRVFMPEVFNQVETILPRLVAQLPRFLVAPVGAEDVEPAKKHEFLMNHAAEQSKLYLELVKAFKDSLMYGTGIVKIRHTAEDEFMGVRRRLEPVFEDVIEPREYPIPDPDSGMPMRDADGGVMVETHDEVVDRVQVGFKTVVEPVKLYEGPVADAVDPFLFWVAPEAEDVQGARYCIHRNYREASEVERLIKQGVYAWPEGVNKSVESFFSESDQEPHLIRQDSIDMGGSQSDSNRRACTVDEYHLHDKRIITVINQRVVVRVQPNPFDHQMKPFVRFTDYLMQHEFYGVGEIEVIEGLQDLVNQITNSRVDEVKLKLHKPMAGNPDLLVDLRDLTPRPGQFIRTRSDARPSEVLDVIDPGDVNTSAFAEVDSAQRMIERATGASSVQQGVTSEAYSDTATGTSILQELGTARFAFKTKIFEIDPLVDLAKQFGTILQQFTPEETVVRMLGEEGRYVFSTFNAADLLGAYDYTIETSSIIQSETVKREQANGLFSTLAPLLTQIPPGGALPPGVVALIEDLLEAYGKKDKSRILSGLTVPALPAAPQEPGIQGIVPGGPVGLEQPA